MWTFANPLANWPCWSNRPCELFPALRLVSTGGRRSKPCSRRWWAKVPLGQFGCRKKKSRSPDLKDPVKTSSFARWKFLYVIYPLWSSWFLFWSKIFRTAHLKEWQELLHVYRWHFPKGVWIASDLKRSKKCLCRGSGATFARRMRGLTPEPVVFCKFWRVENLWKVYKYLITNYILYLWDI